MISINSMDILIICVVSDTFDHNQANFIVGLEQYCEKFGFAFSIRSFDSSKYKHDKEIVSLPAYHLYESNKFELTGYGDIYSLKCYMEKKRNKPVGLLRKLIKALSPTKSPLKTDSITSINR
jgi:hypothetical protein